MARNFNGGTDQIHWYDNSDITVLTSESLSFWIKTTQTTSNTKVWENWSNSSRRGLGILLNNVANKITAVGYNSSAEQMLVVSTTSVNDGNWHHVAVTADRNSAGRNDVYIDGISEANVNSSAAWTWASNLYYTGIGDSFDSFWASFVGDLAEVAHWANVKLTADEVMSLAKGVRPSLVSPHALDLYAPLCRDVTNIISPTAASPLGVSGTSGTTVTDHPRIYG